MFCFINSQPCRHLLTSTASYLCQIHDAAPHGIIRVDLSDIEITDMLLQLSKEDEAATGSEEKEVTREDQDKINKYDQACRRVRQDYVLIIAPDSAGCIVARLFWRKN